MFWSVPRYPGLFWVKISDAVAGPRIGNSSRRAWPEACSCTCRLSSSFCLNNLFSFCLFRYRWWLNVQTKFFLVFFWLKSNIIVFSGVWRCRVVLEQIRSLAWAAWNRWNVWKESFGWNVAQVELPFPSINIFLFGYVRVNGLIMWMCNNEKEHRIFYMGQLAKRNLRRSFFKTLTALAVDHPSHLYDHLPDYNTSMSIMTKTAKVYSFSTKRQRKIKRHKHHSQYKSVSYNRKFMEKKNSPSRPIYEPNHDQQKHHFIHFLWLQGLGDFSPTTKEAIYQSVAHASPAGAIIRVGEQVHPFKRLGV